jgi:hypothetical protein
MQILNRIPDLHKPNWNNLKGETKGRGFVIYTGSAVQETAGFPLLNWKDLSALKNT